MTISAFDYAVAAGPHFSAEWDAQRSEPVDPIDRLAFSELEDLAGGDAEFLRDLLETYLDQTKSLVADARHAAAAGRRIDFVRAVHTLSGSSRNVGALAVARLCSAIELDASGGSNPVSLAPLLGLLDESLVAVCTAVRAHVPPDTD